MTKWEVYFNKALLHTKIRWLSLKIYILFSIEQLYELQAELGAIFWKHILLERLTNYGYWETHVLKWQIFSKKYNELSEPVLKRKKTWLFPTNDKIWAFQWKLEFWKTWIYYYELGNLLIITYFYDEMDSDININK